MKRIIAVLAIILLFSAAFCQQEEETYTDNDYTEQITLSRDISFVEALSTLEVLSQLYENRKIINTSYFNNAIGIPVKQLHWKDALMLVVGYNRLILEEKPGAYIVKDADMEKEAPIAEEKVIITPNSRQVRISSIFFKADKSLKRELGINWESIISGEVGATVNFVGGNKLDEDILNASITKDWETGDVTISVDALIRILEANQKGVLLARPTVTVLSGKKGFIQVGQDFSVKTLDEAGNTTEKFYETGVILEVTPKVLVENEREAIHLTVKVEKSFAIPGDLSTIINKSKSSTDVLLFDGEETVIGGLYDSDIKIERNGIPILKDLPWWVFGLKFIFGYNSYSVIQNEMIIILKAELVDDIDIRKSNAVLIEEQIKENRLQNTKADKLFEEKK